MILGEDDRRDFSDRKRGYIDAIKQAKISIKEDMFFYSQDKDNGYLVAADFQKAFDSVDHEFLFKVLELFGFGDSFLNWVKILYTDTSSCVMNGGRSTGYFNINRGVRDKETPYHLTYFY